MNGLFHVCLHAERGEQVARRLHSQTWVGGFCEVRKYFLLSWQTPFVIIIIIIILRNWIGSRSDVWIDEGNVCASVCVCGRKKGEENGE